MNDEDLYNSICKEATESNYYGGEAISKDTLLYKLIANFAAEFEVPMDNIVIKVELPKFPIKKKARTIIISPAYLSGSTSFQDFRVYVKEELKNYSNKTDWWDWVQFGTE